MTPKSDSSVELIAILICYYRTVVKKAIAFSISKVPAQTPLKMTGICVATICINSKQVLCISVYRSSKPVLAFPICIHIPRVLLQFPYVFTLPICIYTPHMYLHSPYAFAIPICFLHTPHLYSHSPRMHLQFPSVFAHLSFYNLSCVWDLNSIRERQQGKGDP